jgi:hypothetical protein
MGPASPSAVGCVLQRRRLATFASSLSPFMDEDFATTRAAKSQPLHIAVAKHIINVGLTLRPATEEPVMKFRLALLTAVLFASTSAFAMHCPSDMKKIDAALAANPKLTEAQLTEVKKLRAEGEVLHKEGKHQESVDTLGKAMKLLNI